MREATEGAYRIGKLPVRRYSAQHPRSQVRVGGEKVAVGRFDVGDWRDMTDLRRFDRHPAGKAMASEPSSDKELREWALKDEMLFSVRNKATGENLGFVHMTTVPEELRSELLSKGVLTRDEADLPLYDSGTLIAPETRTERGLGSSARRQVLQLVGAMQNKVDEDRYRHLRTREYLGPDTSGTIHPRCVILAFVNEEDQGAGFEQVELSVLASGFEITGKRVRYEAESKTEDWVYKLNWDKLRELIRKRETTSPQLSVGEVSQNTIKMLSRRKFKANLGRRR